MKVNELETLLNDHVQGPSDFPPGEVAPGLRQLDEALRCEICQELYLAPMTLNCGHSFCSGCLREALAEKKQCPKCRQDASEVHMRKNIAMDSVVRAWRIARELILKLTKEEEHRITRHDSQSEGCQMTPWKKRKRAASSGSQGSSDDEIQIIEGQSTHAVEALQVKVESAENEHVRRRTGSSGAHTPITPEFPDSSLVECPVCHSNVPINAINAHLDSNCSVFSPPVISSSSSAAAPLSNQPRLRKGKQKQQWANLLSGAKDAGSPKRKAKEKEKERARSESSDGEYLPKVSYDTLKDKHILELLYEHGLPTTGDRNAWIKRHRKWVVIYNANLDQDPSERHTRERLRRELRRWEESLRPRKKSVVGDAATYQKAHKAEFAQLVKAARPKRDVSAKPETVAEEVIMSSIEGSEEFRQDTRASEGNLAVRRPVEANES